CRGSGLSRAPCPRGRHPAQDRECLDGGRRRPQRSLMQAAPACWACFVIFHGHVETKPRTCRKHCAFRLGLGGRAAVLEMQRMTVEKTAAMLEAQAAAGVALATGSSSRAAVRKAVAAYRRRVKSSRRRLMRSLT